MKLLDFSIKPLDYTDDYFGFSLKNNPLYLMPDNTIHHNSGKSVVEQNIIGHVSRHSDRFQLVGIDCKQVEFNLIQGVKGVKGVALDVFSAANIAKSMQMIMYKRYKFLRDQFVNNIYKIKDLEVDYYEIFGRTVQFDELFEVTVDIPPKHPNHKKLIDSYPDGRMPLIMSIEDIYRGLHKGEFSNPQLQEIKGYNSYIGKNSIRKTRGMFVPKVLLLLADELNELMESDDYQSTNVVKAALGSIARLGRAAAVHLALACQKANSSTINSDLRNNIYLFVLLGNFDSTTSTTLLDGDYSHLSKPEIKGRAIMKSGKEMVELQTYYTEPSDTWEFDEDNKLIYKNPEYLKQKEKKGEEIDSTGFVAQYKLDPSEWSADTTTSISSTPKDDPFGDNEEEWADIDMDDDSLAEFLDDVNAANSSKGQVRGKKADAKKPKMMDTNTKPSSDNKLGDVKFKINENTTVKSEEKMASDTTGTTNKIAPPLEGEPKEVTDMRNNAVHTLKLPLSTNTNVQAKANEIAERKPFKLNLKK